MRTSLHELDVCSLGDLLDFIAQVERELDVSSSSEDARRVASELRSVWNVMGYDLPVSQETLDEYSALLWRLSLRSSWILVQEALRLLVFYSPEYPGLIERLRAMSQDPASVGRPLLHDVAVHYLGVDDPDQVDEMAEAEVRRLASDLLGRTTVVATPENE